MDEREREDGVVRLDLAVKLPLAREYQRHILEHRARFKLLICGRRWGKTKLGLMAACQGHGPKSEWKGALDGARIGWIVPSEEHPSSAEVWNDLKKALGSVRLAAGIPALKGPREARISEVQRLIQVPGGGSVQVWSGFHPDGLRGPWFDGVVVDECSLQSEELWQALRPTLSDYAGWALLLGTVPKDVVKHWFVDLHRKARTPEWQGRGWQTWRRPSADNPQLAKADAAEARETLGERAYLREYEARLLSVAGGIWKEEWLRPYLRRRLRTR